MKRREQGRVKMKRLCPVDGCGKPLHAHGYCSRHAYHFKAHGDPLGGRRGASPGEPLRWILENAAFDGDDCLKWPFEVGRGGYGTIKHDGKKRVASRVMCEVAHGLPPEPKLDAAHNCGNGHLACMNPRHLRWATRAENIEDAKAHGTWVRGQMAKSKNLNEDAVREIRRLAGVMGQAEIAARFGIGQPRVSRIVNRRAWTWVE